MTALLLDGKALAATRRETLASTTAAFVSATGIVPKLVVIMLGDQPASAVYVRNKQRASAAVGFAGEVLHLPEETTQAQLLELIARLNADVSTHGILVQLPLPPHIHPTTVLDAISPLKDVDAFHPENVGLISQGRPRYLPCTPRGVQVLLQANQIETAGRHVVILGRSDIVGKPLALMLAQKGPGADATVTICHSRTRNLPAITRSADILIAAMGQPEFVTAEMVQPGATVIDVGINRVGERLVGDVDFAGVSAVASAITPVPGGIGPMTIAMLLENTLCAARLQTA